MPPSPPQKVDSRELLLIKEKIDVFCSFIVRIFVVGF